MEELKKKTYLPTIMLSALIFLLVVLLVLIILATTGGHEIKDSPWLFIGEIIVVSLAIVDFCGFVWMVYFYSKHHAKIYKENKEIKKNQKESNQ